jgi:hypothetical protein
MNKMMFILLNKILNGFILTENKSVATVAIFRLDRNTAIILFLFTTRAQGTQRSHKELCVTFVPVVPLR